MAEIVLANGKGIALIDDEDVGRIPLTGWGLHPMGYARHGGGAGRWCPNVLLHRVVTGAGRGEEVDHINHNKLDCRKANLRIVTHAQNGHNRKGAQRNNRLGLRGVSWQRKPSGTIVYFARVMVNRKAFYRCGFRTAKEAAQAARELRRLHLTHSQENTNG